MSLSRRSIEMLLDLVEIKLSYMDVSDREDARDMQILERARAELRALDQGTQALLANERRRLVRPRADVA
jgi:hypothetical protein